MLAHKVFVLGAAGALCLLGLAFVGCKDHPHNPPPVDGGQGGEGGCPVQLHGPLFTVEVTAEGGLVPADTTITVDWSAGTEPPFVLSDPATWKTADDGNVVCDVDPAAPLPADLAALVCELWTSGPTAVFVEAKGFVPYKETLTPGKSEACEGPTPTVAEIQLAREVPDAGTPP
ncbi:hypothetical protein [Polyangium aurulentum]|uniref:hypothetical protein n=1 Tax=Polyangium aurulentum TaxID=2567896 RepID=UPI0010AEA1F8|nr:hypothetical protein [Polyangium aurulentum]UQA59661.1 hypothetical protein E8A73_003910 [Polyangium aurulentum]